MRLSYGLWVLCVGGLVAAIPVASHAAAARKLGGSGFSGTLSTDPATRAQQLICDPDDPTRGATSTAYDPALVRLVNLGAGPGYIVGGAVQLTRFDPELGTFSEPFFQNLFGPGGFFFQDSADPNVFETGLVRVIYEKFGTTGQITPTGTILDDKPGVTGENSVDTHALYFEPLYDPFTGGVVDNTFAQYTVFAGPNDFMEGVDDEGNTFRLGPDQLTGVVVGLPEPAAGVTLLIAVGLALGGRSRRTRSA